MLTLKAMWGGLMLLWKSVSHWCKWRKDKVSLCHDWTNIHNPNLCFLFAFSTIVVEDDRLQVEMVHLVTLFMKWRSSSTVSYPRGGVIKSELHIRTSRLSIMGIILCILTFSSGQWRQTRYKHLCPYVGHISSSTTSFPRTSQGMTNQECPVRCR